MTALDQTVEAGKPVASMPDLVRMETVNAYEFIPSGHELRAITIQGDFDNYKTKADRAEIKDADGADVTSNYVFEYVDGNLTVTPRNLEAALVEVDGSYTFNGAEIEPAASAVTVTLDGDELLNGTDYSISSYSDNIHAGTAKVIITGKGAFTGEASGSFTIGAKELSATEITVSTAIWDGSAQEPNVQVYDPETGVVSPMEYNLLYTNNIKVGNNTATVTVTDREGGDYIVSGSAAFSIQKAAMRTLETINRNISKDDKSPRISIASMLPADAGAATGYDLWEEPIRNGVVLNDCLVNTKGEIELEIKSGVASDWVMVSCWIKGENYDVTFWVKLTLTSLKTPEYTAPTAAALSYTGSAQKLLIPGTVTKGGKFEYSEDMNDWSEEIPEGTEAGEYTVYYRLTSTTEYNGVEATPIYVRIRNAAYRLTVENGEGSGDYEEGERVTISAAAAPAGQIFDKWSSEDTVVFEDDGASTTSLTMPGKAVTVSATYKKDEKPQAVLKKAPVAKDLKYNWSSQVLVTAGSADGGDLYYAIGKSTKKAPAESSFNKTLPYGEEPGYYYVWYYVKGDSTHSSTAPECVTAVIRDKNGELPDPSGEVDVSGDSPLNPTVIVDSFTTELHLVKGQKGTIDKSLWKSSKDCGFKSSGKQLTVSKKGVIVAKKATSAGEYVFLTSNSSGKSIKISIAQPGFSSKKLSMEAGENMSAGFTTGDSELGVYYYSSAPDIATIDQSGNIKAVSKGNATITAYVNGKAYSIKLKVGEKDTAVLRTMHLIEGNKKTIKLKGVKKVEWQSSNPSVVEVLNAKKGKIKASGTGKAELTAVSGGTTYRISVTVEDPSINTAGISRKGKKGYSYTAEMYVNEELPLKFVSLDIAEHPVIFKSSKPAVAYVDENGNIVALSKGKTKLTAGIDGKKVTISLTVK